MDKIKNARIFYPKGWFQTNSSPCHHPKIRYGLIMEMRNHYNQNCLKLQHQQNEDYLMGSCISECVIIRKE